MAEDVQGILALVSRYGYLIVFIAGLVEALPLLGWLVPGQAVIIIAGALAAGGVLSLPLLMVISIPAGIIGDGIGYWIGRRFGREFLEKYGARVRITPRHLESSDRLFQKYGAFALVIARFSFLTRAVGPILAGMSKMRPSLFWPINVLGAVAWSASYALLGYFFGLAFLELQGVVGKILAWTLLAVVGLYAFYRILRKYADQFTRDDLYIALIGVGAGATFGIIADRVQKQAANNVLDAHAAAFLEILSPAAPFFAVVELLTSFIVVGALALGAFAVFFVRKRWWDATLVAFGVGGIILLVETLRPLFRAALPPGPGDSFPSASAATPLVFVGVVTYLVAAGTRRKRGPVTVALLGAFVAGTAQLSRLAQGAEYPSAVLAGLALGIAWLSVTILVVEFRLKRNIRAPPEPIEPLG
ncbi:MAG TPA: VTT domain-containing protein [Candidatus Thermoplasmatota archaeon]|nr:VTT domain-containing protein [Candidatus Thermoplasmatota archaeon]